MEVATMRFGVDFRGPQLEKPERGKLVIEQMEIGPNGGWFSKAVASCRCGAAKVRFDAWTGEPKPARAKGPLQAELLVEGWQLDPVTCPRCQHGL